ncbi:MAG: ATP-binding cassette domain-containing protein [Candidatus Riflebacteria bacterium]|nr:ATP-binding cassette domain-containing protein [Candidatus Riflebacteria bacterium]
MKTKTDSTIADATKIEIAELTFKRGEQTIINKLSHEFSGGGVTLLTGPSGCGKTTFLRLLAGLEAPDSGEVTANGRLWSSASQILPPWLRNLDLLFQNDALWPDQTVGNQIAWVRERRKNGNPDWNIEEITAELGINDLLNRYPAGLSGGEARRCQLARVLAGSPSLLLLDEPLSGQDAVTAGKTAQLLAKLLAGKQVTAIVVSHETALFEGFDWQQLYLPNIND